MSAEVHNKVMIHRLELSMSGTLLARIFDLRLHSEHFLIESDVIAYEQTGVTAQSIRIGDFNKDEFLPGNPFTTRNFPGFQLGVMYRIYIEYYDAAGNTLNTGQGDEVSVFSTPMVKASPPLVCVCVRVCARVVVPAACARARCVR